MLGTRTLKWGIATAAIATLFVANAWAQAGASAPQKPGTAAAAPAKVPQFADVDQYLKKDHDLSSDVLEPKITEDWSTPSLKGSVLIPSDPIGGDVQDDPQYSFELVRVLWRPGDPIDLYIMKPKGVAKPPVILYLYSFPFDNDRYLNDSFRRFLVKNGFAAVGFVGALTGQRFHPPRSLNEWFVSDLQEALATSAHDVQMILNYLATRGDMDMDRVGMYGEGSGASIAILAAAVDPRFKAVDLVDPWGDWPDWLAKSTRIPGNERAGLMTPHFLAGVAPLDPLKWLPQLKNRRVRIEEVMSVSVTPAEARQKIEAAAPANAEVVRYEDAKAYGGTVKNGTVFDWIKQQLPADHLVSRAGEHVARESSDQKKQ